MRNLCAYNPNPKVRTLLPLPQAEGTGEGKRTARQKGFDLFLRRQPFFAPSIFMKPFRLILIALFAVLHSLRADPAVVFNEIMYHPATNEANLEWVELYNQMAVDMD